MRESEEQDQDLPVEVLDTVVLAAQLGVEARQHMAQVVKPAQARWHVAVSDTREELVGGDGGEAAVGRVYVELGDSAGERLESPPAYTYTRNCSESKFDADFAKKYNKIYC